MQLHYNRSTSKIIIFCPVSVKRKAKDEMRKYNDISASCGNSISMLWTK